MIRVHGEEMTLEDTYLEDEAILIHIFMDHKRRIMIGRVVCVCVCVLCCMLLEYKTAHHHLPTRKLVLHDRTKNQIYQN